MRGRFQSAEPQHSPVSHLRGFVFLYGVAKLRCRSRGHGSCWSFSLSGPHAKQNDMCVSKQSHLQSSLGILYPLCKPHPHVIAVGLEARPVGLQGDRTAFRQVVVGAGRSPEQGPENTTATTAGCCRSNRACISETSQPRTSAVSMLATRAPTSTQEGTLGCYWALPPIPPQQ